MKYKRRKKEGKNETNKNNELDYVMMIIKRYEHNGKCTKNKTKTKKKKKKKKKKKGAVLGAVGVGALKC